jgi:hypothetical protein
MRTTITLDDDLVAKAQALTGLQEKSALVHVAQKGVPPAVLRLRTVAYCTSVLHAKLIRIWYRCGRDADGHSMGRSGGTPATIGH